MSAAKLGELVSRLNVANQQALATEWEVIITNALANVLPVANELVLNGPRNLDVMFTLPSGGRIVADICAISDESLDRDNPTLSLTEHLSRRLQKRGISGKFGIAIGGYDPIRNPDRSRPRKRLKLPDADQFAASIFDTSFDDFLKRIRDDPSGTHRHSVDNEKASLSFVYSPGHGSLSFRYPPYYLADDLVRNPVHQALKMKADQIKDVVADAPGYIRGVILCDGGCKSFDQTSGGFAHHTPGQIIHRFLSKRTSVDFVCMVGVGHEPTLFSTTHGLSFRALVYSPRKPELAIDLERIFEGAFNTLPRPIRSGQNAYHFLKAVSRSRRYYRDSYSTGSVMSHRSISISLRAVLDYAAGKLTKEEYEKLAGVDAVERLKRFLDLGHSVTSIQIQNAGATASPPALRDGDFAVINFGEPDPAVSPFTVPSPK